MVLAVEVVLSVARIWWRLIDGKTHRGMDQLMEELKGVRVARMIRRKSWDAGMFSIYIVSEVGWRGELAMYVKTRL